MGCVSGTLSNARFQAAHNTLVAVGGVGPSLGPVAQASLEHGARAQFAVNLEARCYVFAVYGDRGVEDLDLSLVNASGQPVASDTSRGPQSTLWHCVSTAGAYTLAVHMAGGEGGFVLSRWALGNNDAAGASARAPGTCENPLPLRLNETVTGSTASGRSEHTGTCLGGGEEDEEGGGRSGAPERVYALTLDRRQLVTVAVTQSGNYDGAVFVRSGACEDRGAEVPAMCIDDDGDTQHSRVVGALDPGTYYIFVDGFGRSRGNYSMTVTARDVPSMAEVCGSAAPLTPNMPVTGQLSAQDINLFQSTCGAGGRGPDRVYRLEVPQESRVQIHQESDYDGVLYVRSACAEQQREVACNDDAGDIQHSRINTVLAAGTYYVYTDAYQSNASGNYTLQADLAPVAGGSLPGDTCADAVPLTLGESVEGNTLAAHDDLRPSCAAATDGYDVVYRFNLATRSRVKLWLDETDLTEASTIALARDCGQIAAGTCRAGAVGEARAVDQILEPGAYFVVVDSATPRRFGRFRLNSRVDDAAAVERLCRAAPLLVPGRTVSGTTSGPDRFQASCAGGARSAENLYRLVVRSRSTVRLSVTSTTEGYDPALYLRANCTDATSERACNDDAGDVHHSQIETNLDPGTYTVFVDGFSANNAGAYTLDVQLMPASGAPNRPITPTPPRPPVRR